MRWVWLLFWVGAAEGAGALGTFFTIPAISGWYATLVRPALAPPSWVFGPVWVMLYLLMGIAAWLVWLHWAESREARRAIDLFALQLVLNAAWSPIFFGLQSLGGALIEIVLLWLAIAFTIRAFNRVSRAAAWLMAPYLAWVTFATYLTAAFWFLNV